MVLGICEDAAAVELTRAQGSGRNMDYFTDEKIFIAKVFTLIQFDLARIRFFRPTKSEPWGEGEGEKWVKVESPSGDRS